MPSYVLMLLDQFGRIHRRIEMECDHDEHAVRMARAHDDGSDMEFWKGGRLVERFQRDGKPPHSPQDAI